MLLLEETINDGRDICTKIYQSLRESQEQASRPNMEEIQRLMEQLLIKLCPGKLVISMITLNTGHLFTFYYRPQEEML